MHPDMTVLILFKALTFGCPAALLEKVRHEAFSNIFTFFFFLQSRLPPVVAPTLSARPDYRGPYAVLEWLAGAFLLCSR